MLNTSVIVARALVKRCFFVFASHCLLSSAFEELVTFRSGCTLTKASILSRICFKDVVELFEPHD